MSRSAAVNGVASFGTLTLDKTGTGYWLTATATGLSTATSSVFGITPGTATQLAFSQQPGTTVANRLITPAVKGRALDALGNLATRFAGNVSVALSSNPGGATLGGTTPVTAVSGVATFFDLSLNKERGHPAHRGHRRRARLVDARRHDAGDRGERGGHVL